MKSKLVLVCAFIAILLGCTPMAYSQTVTVTDYIKSFEGWDDSDWYWGVVENQGDTTAVFSDVYVSYYDEDGALIYSDSCDLDVNFLGAGEKAPFTLIVDHMNYTSLEFSVESSGTEMSPYREFTITEESRGTDYLGTNSITYSVKNTGEIDVTMPTLYGIYYDASGNFLDYSTSYSLEAGEIKAGETVSLLIEFIPLETKDIYLLMDGFYSTSSTGGDITTGGDTSSTTGGDTQPTPDPDANPEPESNGGIPGFPVFSALVGVASISLLSRRKRI